MPIVAELIETAATLIVEPEVITAIRTDRRLRPWGGYFLIHGDSSNSSHSLQFPRIDSEKIL